MLGTKTDRAGRALVDPFLKVVEAPGVFVVGDAAWVMQNEHPVPGVAQAAIQEGRYVGRLIAKELKGREVKRPFRYFDKGNMAVVGKNYAVLERGSAAHKRLPDMAGVGIRSHPLPAAAAEPPARATPVDLVVFHRPAQLAPHPRTAADDLIEPPYHATLADRVACAARAIEGRARVCRRACWSLSALQGRAHPYGGRKQRTFPRLKYRRRLSRQRRTSSKCGQARRSRACDIAPEEQETNDRGSTTHLIWAVGDPFLPSWEAAQTRPNIY